MKFQRQGYCECFPTVVAMLSGLSRRHVIKTLLKGTSHSVWVEYLKEHQYSPQIVSKLMPRVQLILPWMPSYCLRANEKLMEEAVSKGGLEPDLTGRGALTVTNLRARHVVAYQDGLIYDPMKTSPMPFQEWIQEQQSYGWSIDFIAKEPARKSRRRTK